MKKSIFVSGCLLVLSACNQPYDEPRYDYKTIKPNLIPYSDWRKDKNAAIDLADSKLDYNAKSSCRSMSQTWNLKEIKNRGEMDCEESTEGYQCRRKNIEVVCRKLNER